MRDLDVGYLGVVVDDRDPQALFDAMVAQVQTRNDGWTPHNAALEVQILEAFAVAGADWIYATNRSVGAMVEALLALNGMVRDDGAPATGQLTLTFDGTVSTTITEGTEFVADDGATLLAVRDTVISAATAAVDVEEAVPGGGTLLTTGMALSPAVGIPRLSTCTLTTALTGGRPAEDDLSFLTRASLRQQRVSRSLVLVEDFTAAALEDPRVGRATTIDRYNCDTSSTVDGHVSVVLHGRGAALSTAVIDELETTLDNQAVSILTVHTRAAQYVALNVTAGITVAAGYDSTDTITAATDAVRAWLAWDNVGFGQTVTPTAIEAVLANVPGVSSALVTAPAGNVTHQAWQLPAPGTLNIHT